MLSRQTSVASSEVIDLSSDTDSDDFVPNPLFNSQSTITASGPSFQSGSLSLNHNRVHAAQSASFTSKLGTSHAVTSNSAYRSARASASGSQFARSPSATSLLSALDDRAFEAAPVRSSQLSSEAPSSETTPVKRTRAPSSRGSSDDEEEVLAPPQKKRKTPAERAPSRSKVILSAIMHLVATC